MKTVGIYNYKLSSEYIDFTGRTSMCTLAGIVLQCAGENAKKNGFGIDDLINNGCTWVLSRIAINMTRLPKLGEDICVHTWIADNNELISERKIVFYDSSDNIIGTSSTMWVVLDIKTRKVLPLSTISQITEIAQGDRGFDINMADRVRCNDAVEIESRMVKYSDLDLNNHVTTPKYIEWIYDVVDIKILNNKPFMSILVNYQNEVLYGEKVSIRQSPTKPFHFDIYSQEGVNTTKIMLA